VLDGPDPPLRLLRLAPGRSLHDGEAREAGRPTTALSIGDRHSVSGHQGHVRDRARREVLYFTFVQAPGCYGWQIDARTFSETIVARVLPPLQA
jgi:hypothetical protein